MIREPAVAGAFYPGTKNELNSELSRLMPGSGIEIDSKGVVSPHAGYMYSGAVAGKVFSAIKPRSTYIVIGPNHTGIGARFAVGSQAWGTPLGIMNVDEDYVSLLLENSRYLELDDRAHAREHSIEVQIPFILNKSRDSKIVPICMKMAEIDEMEEIAVSIIAAAGSLNRDFTVIASSDMTHYESRDSASKKDGMAIDNILKLDPAGLLKTVGDNNISMCGCMPVALMLIIARKMGALKSELIEYADSGQVTGDDDQVVGYAGIVVS